MSCTTCGKGSLIKRVAHGAAGLSKAALRIDRLPDAEIERRRNFCRVCPKRNKPKKRMTTYSICMACLCYIVPKTTLATEQCPIGKW